MNAATLARLECANHKMPSECILRKDGCIVFKKERCAYFEKSVLPLSRLRPERFPGVIADYLKHHPTANLDRDSDRETRSCPDCGKLLAPRKRVCPACADLRRRKTYRVARHAQQLTEITS